MNKKMKHENSCMLASLAFKQQKHIAVKLYLTELARSKGMIQLKLNFFTFSKGL